MINGYTSYNDLTSAQSVVDEPEGYEPVAAAYKSENTISNLEYLALKKGISSDKMAHDLGVNRGVIKDLEDGYLAYDKNLTLQKVADYLGYEGSPANLLKFRFKYGMEPK